MKKVLVLMMLIILAFSATAGGEREYGSEKELYEAQERAAAMRAAALYHTQHRHIGGRCVVEEVISK